MLKMAKRSGKMGDKLQKMSLKWLDYFKCATKSDKKWTDRCWSEKLDLKCQSWAKGGQNWFKMSIKHKQWGENMVNKDKSSKYWFKVAKRSGKKVSERC